MNHRTTATPAASSLESYVPPPKASADDARMFITVFFDRLDERSRFLERLFIEEREMEALTLCCCYLDGLARYRFSDERSSAKRFARLLIEFAPDPALKTHNAGTLWEWAREQDNKKHLPAAESVCEAVGGHWWQLHSPEDFEALARRALTPPQFASFRGHLWRGSTAAVIYRRLRSPSVHELGSAGGLVIGYDAFGPGGVSVDFFVLNAALQHMSSRFRADSMATGTWFGLAK